MISMRPFAQSLVLSRTASALLGAAAIVMSAGYARPAQSAVLQVSPVKIEFEAVQSAQAVQVFNSGHQDLDAQVRVMRWTQENGQDKLTPAQDIVASPAIMRVAPGQRQTVRLVRLQPAPPSQQLGYRVLVDELPSKEAPKGIGLKVLMRYSIPLFIDTETTQKAPPGTVVPAPAKTDLRQVRAQLTRNMSGATELRMSNQSPQAIRISALVATLPGGETRAIEAGLVGYVLAGQEMGWKIKLPYPMPAGMTLKARFNDDSEAQAVPLDGAGR